MHGAGQSLFGQSHVDLVDFGNADLQMPAGRSLEIPVCIFEVGFIISDQFYEGSGLFVNPGFGVVLDECRPKEANIPVGSSAVVPERMYTSAVRPAIASVPAGSALSEPAPSTLIAFNCQDAQVTAANPIPASTCRSLHRTPDRRSGRIRWFPSATGT